MPQGSGSKARKEGFGGLQGSQAEESVKAEVGLSGFWKDAGEVGLRGQELHVG